MATPNMTAITSVTPGVVAQALASAPGGTLYTVPTNKAVKLTRVTAANITLSPVTVYLNILPSGGSVGFANNIVPSFSLAGADTTTFTELDGFWLGQGDQIVIGVSVSSAVAFTVNGLVFA